MAKDHPIVPLCIVVLSFLVPRAFTAGEMDSMTDVSGAKWAPDGAVQVRGAINPARESCMHGLDLI